MRGSKRTPALPARGLNAARLGMRLAIEMDTYLHERYNAIDAMFEPPISTFEPTKREKNVDNVNTIPGTDVYYFDCRILPVYRIDDVLTDVRKLAESFCSIYGCKINVEVVNREDPSQPTPPDSPVVTGLINALKRTRGGVSAVPVGIGGGAHTPSI